MVTKRSSLLIESALVWLGEGIAVVPAQPLSKVCNLRWRQYEQNLPTQHQIFTWFEGGENNLAVVCGTGRIGEKLLVVDFDDTDLYKAWLVKAGSLATSYTEVTGRGVHVYFRVDKPVSAHCSKGIELLGLGHLCMVAPSIHPNGQDYQVLSDPCDPLLKVTTDQVALSLLSEKDLCSQVQGISEHRSLSKKNAGSHSDVVTRIKAAYPLFDQVKQLIPESKLRASGGNGRWWIGVCPFHVDHHPSFWVDSERGLWRCMSSDCIGNKGGDVINLLAIAHHNSIAEEIKLLAGGLPHGS